MQIEFIIGMLYFSLCHVKTLSIAFIKSITENMYKEYNLDLAHRKADRNRGKMTNCVLHNNFLQVWDFKETEK